MEEVWPFCSLNSSWLIGNLFSFLQATGIHGDIDEAAEAMKEVVQDLLKTLENAATEAGVVSGFVNQISKAISYVSSFLNRLAAALLKTSGALL